MLSRQRNKVEATIPTNKGVLIMIGGGPPSECRSHVTWTAGRCDSRHSWPPFTRSDERTASFFR